MILAAIPAVLLLSGGASGTAEAKGWKLPEYVKTPAWVKMGLLTAAGVKPGAETDPRQFPDALRRGVCGIALADKEQTQDFFLPGGPSGPARPDSMPLRLRSFYLTDKGSRVRDAHAYLHPKGEHHAVRGRWVMAKESLFDWLGRRWDLYQKHICSGSDGSGT
jgi:hypothetical protein